MSVINTLNIDTSLMPNSAITRSFNISGKKNSEFTVIATQDGTIKFYNWETAAFEDGHSPKNNLNVTMTSNVYRNNITFPSGSGTYIIKVLTKEGTSTTRNSAVLSKTIEKQGSAATITFTPATINSTNYQTFPTSTSTGNVSDSNSLDYTWTVKNASTDAGGFGLIFDASFNPEVKTLDEFYYYVEVDEAIVSNLNGDGENSNIVSVGDLTGLAVGMELYYHKGTTTPRTYAGTVYATGAVHITNIDVNNKTIEFNNVVAFEDSETMKFRGYGSKIIEDSTGANIAFGDVTVTAPILTATVRADVNGTTISLLNTHGISGGNTISYKGVGVDNSSSNKVTNVNSPDCPDLSSSGALDNDGTIIVQLTQELSSGTILTFERIHKEVELNANIIVVQHPQSNTTVKLDLEKFLTPGVQA